LDLTDCIVTIDAMGTQTAIAQQIIEQQVDYVLALKGNQGRIDAGAQELFRHASATAFRGIAYQTTQALNKGHGRIEQRHYTLVTDGRWVEYLNEGERWAGLAGIGRVEAERRMGDMVSTDVRYYITSGAALPCTASLSSPTSRNRLRNLPDAKLCEDRHLPPDPTLERACRL
jgi:predicted transposase YbfD/YdcC